MKYEGVCIAVKDIKLAKKFYQDIFGLQVLTDYGINISFGGLSLQQEFDWLLDISNDKIINRPHNMELYFEEDNFDAFIARLLSRTDIEYLGGGVKQTPWGQRSIRFYDLDGHVIEVGENLKIVVQKFLNSGLSLEEVSKRMDISVDDLKTISK